MGSIKSLLTRLYQENIRDSEARIPHLLSAVVHGLLEAFTIVLKLANRCSVQKPRSKLINIPILKMSS